MKKLLLGLFLTTTILSYGRVVSRPVSVRPSISRPVVSRPTPVRVSSPKPVSVRPSTVKPAVHKATPIRVSTPKTTSSSSSFFKNTTKTSTTIPVKTYSTSNSNTNKSSFYSTPSSNFIGTNNSSNWFNNWWLYRTLNNNRRYENNIDKTIIEIEKEIAELEKDKVKNARQIEFLKKILIKLKGER